MASENDYCEFPFKTFAELAHDGAMNAVEGNNPDFRLLKLPNSPFCFNKFAELLPKPSLFLFLFHFIPAALAACGCVYCLYYAFREFVDLCDRTD